MTNSTTQLQKRQLVICSDGTNNNLTGGATDTNVVKLMQLIDQDQGQLLFYDPGVGNPGALPGATMWDKLNRKLERIAGLAFGRGVYENIAEAYIFLMHNYRAGDELYFFGFSRGAFTARCVAGMVNQFGILDKQMTSMVPTLLNVYFSERAKDHKDDKFKKIAQQIRDRFSVATSLREAIHFVGVWDTVASVGAPPFAAKMTAAPTIQGEGKRFRHVRQALALDEHRATFAPRIYQDNNGVYNNPLIGQTTIKQLWFNGAHCDVGGGYENADAVLSNEALVWITDEARQCGLRLSINQQLLTSQEEIAQAFSLAALASPAVPKIHSETYSTCLWAIAGLHQRDPSRCDASDKLIVRVIPEAYHNVAARPLTFPKDTEWASTNQSTDPKISTSGSKWLLVATSVAITIFFLLGALLTKKQSSDWLETLSTYAHTNVGFITWQLGGWFTQPSIYEANQFAHPYWALTFDFLFIAAYAYLLAWFVARAFAKIAGISTGRPNSRKWLNRLGMALPVAIAADVAENIVTAIVIASHSYFPQWLSSILAVVMSLSALTNLIAILGVLILIFWGTLHRQRS